MSCQRIKLIGKRHPVAACHHELSFTNHVHEFDAGQDVSGGPKGFEVEHRFGHALDGAMVLLDDIVEVFDLAHIDRPFPVFIDRIDGRLVGAALVHRDFFRHAVGLHGLVKKAHGQKRAWLPPCRTGRQQKIDRFEQPLQQGHSYRRVRPTDPCQPSPAVTPPVRRN